jgi:integrase
MKVIDLIRDYERTKAIHEPVSESLGGKLVQLREVFGSLPADSTGNRYAIEAQRRWGKGSPGTVKRQLVQIKAVLNHAARSRLIDSVPYIPVPTVHDTRHVDITGIELNCLLDHIEQAHPKEYPLVIFLSHTGGRMSEVLSLAGEDFSPAGVTFRKDVARRSKTITRTIQMTPRLREAVTLYGFMPDAGQTLRAKLGYKDRSQASSRLRATLIEACDAVGLPVLRAHDLRHAFAALIAERGGDLADIASLLGHSSLSSTLRYRGLVRGKADGLLRSI